MGTLIVPDINDMGEWPTLGPQICDFLEARSIYGPGSLRGQPYKVSPEKRAATYRAYELYPKGHRFAGRRRFRRVAISWRKGTAKTEWAAEVAYAELHPEGPVRFDGWDANGNPVGKPVGDPYIPMLAYTEEQTEELAYGALYVICMEGPDADLFDTGKERIIRLNSRGMADGKAVALSGSPNANDGARTTFEHFDETHRMELPRLVAAHNTMIENLPKRILDDPWALETTTAGRPGGGSVAEETHREALAIEKGEIEDPELFYFHREAGSHHDMKTLDGRIAAVSEATGPEGEYGPGHFHSIAKGWDRPGADKTYLERVWLNRWTRSDAQAFDVRAFEALGSPDTQIAEGAFCTLGFDGARFRDSTAFVLTEIPTGKQQLLALWERPLELSPDASWEVPVDEVTEVFEDAMKRYNIFKLYADPPHWVETVADWAGKYPDVVVEYWTHNRRKIAMAIRAFAEAIESGQLTHNGDLEYVRHVGNAGRNETNLLDEEGKKIWILDKLRPDAKFDACMAGILSWWARIEAMADGASPGPDMFVPYRLDRGARTAEVIPDAIGRQRMDSPGMARRPKVTYGPPR